MTLEEAIEHAMGMAGIHGVLENPYNQKCAEEHRQLAEWLKLLKRILDSGDCNDCAMLHSQCRYAPRWGEQVRYNCPFYSREKDPQDGFTKWAKSVADSYRNDKGESE